MHDTLLQIQNAGLNVRKPLKVQFFGEEGVDEGGVQKVRASQPCSLTSLQCQKDDLLGIYCSLASGLTYPFVHEQLKGHLTAHHLSQAVIGAGAAADDKAL